MQGIEGSGYLILGYRCVFANIEYPLFILF